MGSSSKVVRPEDVLESLKNDGSIDALRMKVIAQLKANVRARILLLLLPSPDPLLFLLRPSFAPVLLVC